MARTTKCLMVPHTNVTQSYRDLKRAPVALHQVSAGTPKLTVPAKPVWIIAKNQVCHTCVKNDKKKHVSYFSIKTRTLVHGGRMVDVVSAISCPMELHISVTLLAMAQKKAPAALLQDFVGIQRLTVHVQTVSTMEWSKVIDWFNPFVGVILVSYQIFFSIVIS